MDTSEKISSNQDFELIKSKDKPPSIIPGVSYPITGRERQIIRYVWRHAQDLKERGLL